ncbi:MAG: hypothetical protein ACQETV_03140 [Actinomycetota bacterium]
MTAGPLAAALAAAALAASAAWHSSRPAARQGIVPPARVRALPHPLSRGLDVALAAVPAALAAGLAAAALVALGTAPVTALAAPAALGWLAAVALTAVTGRTWDRLGPPALLARDRPAPPRLAALGVWPAAVALALLALLATTAHAAARPATASVAAGVVVAWLGATAALGRLAGRRSLHYADPATALSTVLARLAPLARRDAGWVWRSPAAALTAEEPVRGTLALAAAAVAPAVVALAPLPGLAGQHSPLATAGWLVVALLGSAALLRLTALRPYLLVAALPGVAGWALAGHLAVLLPALGLAAPAAGALAAAVLLAGHLLTIAAAHRAALARFDPRAARAVQFPLRAVALLSAGAGAGWALG